LPATRVGTIAHSQLQFGAGIVSGTISEVAVALPSGIPAPRRLAVRRLYNTARAPIKLVAPVSAGSGGWHRVNPLGWPVARVPPASTAIGRSW
jgi:hypothetical protein